MFEAKRQLELLRAAHESLKLDSEKQLQDLKRRNKEEITDLAEDNHRLQLLVDEQKDQHEIRRLKRELEDSKRRLQESQ